MGSERGVAEREVEEGKNEGNSSGKKGRKGVEKIREDKEDCMCRGGRRECGGRGREGL